MILQKKTLNIYIVPIISSKMIEDTFGEEFVLKESVLQQPKRKLYGLPSLETVCRMPSKQEMYDAIVKGCERSYQMYQRLLQEK